MEWTLSTNSFNLHFSISDSEWTNRYIEWSHNFLTYINHHLLHYISSSLSSYGETFTFTYDFSFVFISIHPQSVSAFFRSSRTTLHCSNFTKVFAMFSYILSNHTIIFIHANAFISNNLYHLSIISTTFTYNRLIHLIIFLLLFHILQETH